MDLDFGLGKGSCIILEFGAVTCEKVEKKILI